ncbi:secondary alcohol dehydrogenase [Colletotrichum truncatum]|uniref:Secondary alcohol dehydrogenase n=1 Tax=Colletotrichum truncatum TaxID=5467 RepID=A0ACC3Z597_COLTU|nr:secondary alcohol dehydrogenase [Colletotrichum truncatum]KAF6795127.1 secondary alcohol dehydrogenase [Colletotrichum truncatum]
MSSADTRPITPTRFAEALKDLSLPTLHLKVLEIRNSILHLEYSNAQLKPYAEGSATTLDAADAAAGRPDQDCVEAIRENEAVIARMQERVDLIRAEVEERGHNWNEFRSKEEVEADAAIAATTTTTNGATATATTNGLGAAREEEERVAGRETTAATTSSTSQHPAWLDGTFQTGTIRNGEIRLDAQPAQPAQQANGTGGRLTDEELRRAMEERMRGLGQDDDDDNEGGMHL